MNAAWQRLWSLLRLGGAIALLARGEPAWAVVLLLATPLGLLLLFLTLAPPSPTQRRTSLAQRLRAWAKECAVNERVFGLDQPWRAGEQAPALAASVTGQRGVLLLHGFSCNRGLWRPWIARLQGAGVPVMALTLEPAFGSIDAYADPIDAAMRQLHAATGQMPVIVAHSMGGLAARAWWRAHGAGHTQAPRLISLGTPHLGTRIATLSPVTNARQMRCGSSWLAQLPPMPDVDCLWSPCDQIVQPAANACQPGARLHRVDATGHLALIDTPEAWALLQQALLSDPQLIDA